MRLAAPVGSSSSAAVGVRLAAPGGAGVERAVADDLQRPHGDPVVRTAEQAVAGAQPGLDHVLEPVAVRRDPDPQQVAARGPALDPVVDATGELEVDQADHALGRGGLERRPVRCRSGAVVTDEPAEQLVGREPLVLAHHVVAGAQAEGGQGRTVEPAVVPVTRDQHDRRDAGDVVELDDRAVAAPAAGPVPPGDDRAARLGGDPLGHQRDGLLGRSHGAGVDTLGGKRPLPEVDVLVPQPGDQPAPGGRDLLDAVGTGDRPRPRQRPGRRASARRPGRREPRLHQARGRVARRGSAVQAPGNANDRLFTRQRRAPLPAPPRAPASPSASAGGTRRPRPRPAGPRPHRPRTRPGAHR